MPRRTRRFVPAALALVVFASPAAAFDHRRQGFVLGFSAGYGSLWMPEWDGGTDQESGVSTELKLGVGLGDRTILHYAGKQMWHRSFIHVFPMIGLTRHLRTESPSAFVTGGGGLGILAGFHDDIDGGLAAFGGVGYEFKPHWSVEVDVVNTFTGDESITVLLVTVGGLAY